MSRGPGLQLPFLHELEKWLDSTNENAGFIIPGWGLMILFTLSILVFYLVAPVQSVYNFELLLFFSPLWVPIVLVRWALQQFVFWRRVSWGSKQKHVLLELKIPRNILKSPLAMEAVFSAIHLKAGEGTWLKRFVFGRTRNWTSFEIASFGGEVHLYVWTRATYRRLIESALYSQYPEIEIIEAIDYSRLRDPSNGNFAIFACEYTLGKSHAYPIKTYVDYGLERPQLRHERQVDPFAGLLELFSAIGPGEQMWTQFIIRFSKGKEMYNRKKRADGQMYSFGDEVQAELAKIKGSVTMSASGVPLATPGQTELMAAIERNTGKLQFDVGIRSIYSAPPEKFYGLMSAYTVSLFTPFNSNAYNELRPANLFSEKFNDYPWEDIGGFRQKQEMREAVEFYRRRSYFHPPYRGPWLTLSSEELATLFHIPNFMVKSPGLSRIETTTAPAPANLPT